jgi:hypothetical protein
MKTFAHAAANSVVYTQHSHPVAALLLLVTRMLASWQYFVCLSVLHCSYCLVSMYVQVLDAAGHIISIYYGAGMHAALSNILDSEYYMWVGGL